MNLNELFAAADLDKIDDRLMLADALEEAGRDEEAALLRDVESAVGVRDGAVREMFPYSVEMRDGGSTETEEFDAFDDADAAKTARRLTREWIAGGDWDEDGASVEAGWTLHRPRYRVVCDGWRQVGDGPEPEGDGMADYDHWYYLDHVGAFAGREIDDREAVWPSEAEARRWAELASADGAADHHGIGPVLSVEEDGEEIDGGYVTVEIEPDHDALIRAAGGDADCDHEWTGEGEGGCDRNPGVWSTGGTSFTIATHCRLCGLHRTEHVCGSQRNPGEHDTVSYEMPSNWCAECEREECECEGEEVTCCVCGKDFVFDEDDGDALIHTDHGPDHVCGDCEYEGDDDE